MKWSDACIFYPQIDGHGLQIRVGPPGLRYVFELPRIPYTLPGFRSSWALTWLPSGDKFTKFDLENFCLSPEGLYVKAQDERNPGRDEANPGLSKHISKPRRADTYLQTVPIDLWVKA